jgi:hypothetical protein
MVTFALLGDHVPPGVASESVMVEATQTEPAPVMPAGSALTVIAFTVKQPPGSVYVMFVVPEAIPVTTPVVLTVPTAVLLLDHVPPDVLCVKVAVLPTQTAEGPEIAAGALLTVTVVTV